MTVIEVVSFIGGLVVVSAIAAVLGVFLYCLLVESRAKAKKDLALAEFYKARAGQIVGRCK